MLARLQRGYSFPCAGKNPAGSEVSGVGATAITWSSEIFMPPTCPKIENKTLVRVLNAAGEVQVTGRVLRFKKYKHYAKLWI